MKNIKDTFFIGFNTLLVLNMLIIFCGLYIYFFDEDDYTVIAGIIAFWGAIIGGYLTWRGVRKSIEHQNLKDRYIRLPEEIKKCWRLHKYIAFGPAVLPSKKYINDEQLIEKVRVFYKATEEEATELAIDIHPEIYKITMRYYTLLDDLPYYLHKGKTEEFKEGIDLVQRTVSTMLEEYEKEYKELAEYFKTRR